VPRAPEMRTSCAISSGGCAQRMPQGRGELRDQPRRDPHPATRKSSAQRTLQGRGELREKRPPARA
ncbi:hypothetical protein, partial [Streptomyces sp. NPDC057694]|uniref:hypothetical protein n=1 Tax=Streptomyces sp. NPDC057694 TaxID=3346216 RepID=UPI0036C4263C